MKRHQPGAVALTAVARAFGTWPKRILPALQAAREATAPRPFSTMRMHDHAYSVNAIYDSIYAPAVGAEVMSLESDYSPPCISPLTTYNSVAMDIAAFPLPRS